MHGRRVDKNALHMVLAERTTTELKSKFQGSLGRVTKCDTIYFKAQLFPHDNPTSYE